jgi:hypothetical protein
MKNILMTIGFIAFPVLFISIPPLVVLREVSVSITALHCSLGVTLQETPPYCPCFKVRVLPSASLRKTAAIPSPQKLPHLRCRMYKGPRG